MILVSICCITYNHEDYIRQCLDGFLIQETSFQFEILIHDDASTDKTSEIIREYELKYPEIIKPIYQTVNQYSKGVRPINKFNFERARGKYIALCEGDDYWTDPLKLQKQVDFLEENEDCSLCFHASKSIRNNDPNDYIIKRPQVMPNNFKFDINVAIKESGGFMATNSMLFHTRYIRQVMPEWVKIAPVGDAPLMLLLAINGKMGYIDDIMSAYRIMSSKTSWSAGMLKFENRKKHYLGSRKMWNSFNEDTEFLYNKIVSKRKRLETKEFLIGSIKLFIKKIIRYNS